MFKLSIAAGSGSSEAVAGATSPSNGRSGQSTKAVSVEASWLSSEFSFIRFFYIQTFSDHKLSGSGLRQGSPRDPGAQGTQRSLGSWGPPKNITNKNTRNYSPLKTHPPRGS
jgi:hypothetical protein